MRQRFRWDSFEAEEIWRENDVCSKEGGGGGEGGSGFQGDCWH